MVESAIKKEQLHNNIYFILLLTELLLYDNIFIRIMRKDVLRLSLNLSAHAMMFLPLLLQLVGLSLVVLIDPYIRKKHKKVMLLIVVFVFSLLMQNYVGYLMDINGKMPFARTVVSIYGYSVRPMILVLFYYIVGKQKSYRFAWILIGLNTAIHLTALFSDVCFRIDESNHFFRGPLGFSCHIVSAVLLAYLVYLTVKENVREWNWGTLTPFLNALLIVVSVLMDTFFSNSEYPVSYLTVAVVSSCVFYYIWLHLQFVHEHERAMMAEQQIQIMMSQIQPHFLYNTLSTIQALCKTDPEKAFSTTEKFGTYLRQNLDSLSLPNLIPVAKELEHTRIYAEIEAIRFPFFRMEYDTPELDFLIPALTVQPLVENAIRHGIRIRKEGVISIVTRKTAAYYEITVTDNGKGFDAEMTDLSDGTHIGLKNVRERVERMCGGTLIVDSMIDRGTSVTIRIPFRARTDR